MYLQQVNHASADTEAPPVLLLHGFCEDHRVYDWLLPHLTELDVWVADLPGFGQSPALGEPFSLDQVATAVHRQWQEKHLPPPAVLGHSLGGYVALAWADHHAEHLAALGLLHSTSQPDGPEKGQIRRSAVQFVQKHGMDKYTHAFAKGLFHPDHVDSRRQALEHLRHIMKATPTETFAAYQLAMNQRPDRQQVLEGLGKPVMMVSGEGDALVPVAVNTAEMAAVPLGTHRTFGDMGHIGMLEAPAKLAHAVLDWTKQLGRG